ncbi:hypothetical protein BST81_24035 [Leptolyngbya sp. 'hensonii']|uniref:hypothetical protein n=1 Tax=Leptolyngbya sp. 'hensonii' TaxID=1922337 RepID=UPI0009657760|nr:hypothetical protein [Leptolyngbya sp. 'hensonii']OLP15893.1 hypothetical protein BST81_24035 [Leptolyngbya sp. 'hensonii']
MVNSQNESYKTGMHSQRFAWIKDVELSASASDITLSNHQIIDQVDVKPVQPTLPETKASAKKQLAVPTPKTTQPKATDSSGKFITAIAVLETLGGVLGIVSILESVALQPSVLGSYFPVIAFFLTLYCLSVLAGIWLWQGQLRGYFLSQVIQFCQVLQISVSNGISYTFVSGAQVILGLILSPRFGAEVNVHLGSLWGFYTSFSWSPEDPEVKIALNLLSLLVLIFLNQKKPHQPRSSTGRLR